MRTLTFLTVLFIPTTSWGQPDNSKRDRFLTFSENANWLKTVKTLEKSEQWDEIRQRFFLNANSNVAADSIQYSPLLVVNGVPMNIPETATKENSERILILLDKRPINGIHIVDELSEQWIFCKPFAGVILLSVDRQTERRIFKLALQ